MSPYSPSAPALDADKITLTSTSLRFQPYRYIHKALRTLFGQTLHLAGQLDAADSADRARLVDEVERLLATCADHLAHENRFLHEPLRQRAPRAVAAFDDDHHGHLASIDTLRLQLQQVRDAASAEDAAAGAYGLYLRLSVFIAENLEHMAEEESTLTLALWTHFSDAELQACEAAIHAALAPEEMAFYLRWMARGLNVSELVQLLQGARTQVPAEVYQGLCALVAGELDAPRRARLALTVGPAGLDG